MAEQKVIMTDPRQEDYFYQEAIKTLRTNIQFAGMDVKTILFTSCYPNEGKSDITFQLSQEIGKLGKKVLLLDADIRKSILASRYGVGKQVQGLSNYLSGQASIAEIIYRTNYENMDIIFSGSFAPNPSELLGQEAFGTLLGAVREHYDYIIVDTPPIGSIIDAAIVAKQCDGAVLVFESELVDPFRCVQCGTCVRVCPKHCLTMDPAYTPIATAKSCRVVHVPDPKAAVTES